MGSEFNPIEGSPSPAEATPVVAGRLATPAPTPVVGYPQGANPSGSYSAKSPSTNPYAAPHAPLANVEPQRDYLRSVAAGQKRVIFALAAQLLSSVALVALASRLPLAAGLIGIVVGLTVAFLAISLSIKVYGPVRGVALGIFTLVPWFGLFFLLVINGRATGILNLHGIHVGFLGADTSRI